MEQPGLTNGLKKDGEIEEVGDEMTKLSGRSGEREIVVKEKKGKDKKRKKKEPEYWITNSGV